MNITLSKTSDVWRILIVDAAILAIICLVPTLSHLFSVPIYKLNPMTLCLLAGMLLVNDRRNAFLLALVLPLVSMLISGMPTPLKCVCMVAELATIVAVFQLAENRMGSFVSILCAMICGKAVYYVLKALIVSPAVLIGTSIWLQVALLVASALLFGAIKGFAKTKK